MYMCVYIVYKQRLLSEATSPYWNDHSSRSQGTAEVYTQVPLAPASVRLVGL